MSDTGAIPEAQVVAVEGAGAMLRAAREAAGLHVAALAVSLKIPVRRLEALEAERWDELPGAVFTRALAASVCRNLKIDPEPVLARLPAAPRSQLPENERLGAPFREGAPTTSGSPRFNALFEGSRALALAVGALVLGAVLLWIWPFVTPHFASPVATEPQPAPSQEPAQTGIPPSFPAQVSAAATAGPTPAAAAAESAASSVSPMPAVATATAPASAAAPVAAASGRALLALSARGDSWIEVTDARGTVVLRRLLKDGENAQLDAAAVPLSVLVGRADVTDVKVRGEPFDLAPLARNNVARFEVK